MDHRPARVGFERHRFHHPLAAEAAGQRREIAVGGVGEAEEEAVRSLEHRSRADETAAGQQRRANAGLRGPAGVQPFRPRALGQILDDAAGEISHLGQRSSKAGMGVGIARVQLDGLAILFELFLQRSQLRDPGHRQSALGAGDGGCSGESVGPREDLHSLGIGLGAIELVDVEEFFPSAFAGLDQDGRGGEGLDEGPRAGYGPILEGFQGRRVILAQGGPELADQGRSLVDQLDLVSAEDSQFLGDGIVGEQGFPSLSVGSQRVGKTPGVQGIVLIAHGALSVAISLGSFGIERIDDDVRLEQPLDGGAVAGLDRDRDLGQIRPRQLDEALAEGGPTLGGVLESHLQNDLSRGDDADGVVVIAGPVESDKQFESFLESGFLCAGCLLCVGV